MKVLDIEVDVAADQPGVEALKKADALVNKDCRKPRMQRSCIHAQLYPRIRKDGSISLLLSFAHLDNRTAIRVQHAICGDGKDVDWIPVSERLPDPLVAVLVVYDDDMVDGPTVDVANRTVDGHWEFADTSMLRMPAAAVTHWGPLPTPPAL